MPDPLVLRPKPQLVSEIRSRVRRTEGTIERENELVNEAFLEGANSQLEFDREWLREKMGAGWADLLEKDARPVSSQSDYDRANQALKRIVLDQYTNPWEKDEDLRIVRVALSHGDNA
jgi:hypothetical protein